MLTEAQREKIEENRLKALKKRHARDQEKQGQSQSAAEILAREGGFKRDDPVEQQVEEKTTEQQDKTISIQSKLTGIRRVLGPLDDNCEVCGSGFIDETFRTIFGVSVCISCKMNNDEDYRLVSKGDAAAEFLIQEGTIRVMPCLERSNPRHSRFVTMKLYLRKQVREKSYERWGGPEGLQQELEARGARRFENALQNTASIFSKKPKTGL